ncbi:bifunctional protein-serine/threonine kinase/phosphatase [Oryzomicrobium sp.]|uniref:bifunctional protein-serine/threonine kinase/phosphatase n=1 Tax=Oryzomicrobium sp. TaxID=1911578 RepID=UPI0025DEA606|nr:bifunctional protein-serine/threonine kinase/phosphatase [Oryzomicrobium sp.]MCE1244322.1 bifunctional protein-serine/threonine kinase/phosphatase [Oryzomicrobium sp.]
MPNLPASPSASPAPAAGAAPTVQPAAVPGGGLVVQVGHASLTGPRVRNEDFCGVVTPEGRILAHKGLMAAVADGVGGHQGGREAAEYTVRGLLSDYYATPDTWSVLQALDKVVQALNRWVLAQAARDRSLAGMATTLTALVLRGRRYYTVHVGDSRIYLLRDGQLIRLTSDHTWEHPELRHVLSRAVGLDAFLAPDFGEGALQAGDRFLLLTDGVWGMLPDARLREVLLHQPDPQQAAAGLASLALAAGGSDNASAVVLAVQSLPSGRLLDSLEAEARLPLPPRLKPGQTLDGLLVEAVLRDSRLTLLYRVRDTRTGQQLVMKTLRPELAGDHHEAARLVAEEWRGRRVVAPFFPQVVPTERRSCLYFLMTWHEGASLQDHLDAGRHFPAAEVVQHGIRLLKALAALHRLEIAHRDVKPANVHLGQDGRLRLLDLGVSISSGEGEGGSGEAGHAQRETPGTPSFMAPELFDGVVVTPGHDLYAAGVTLYHLLTRRYPYGEIEPFQHPRFGEPVPPSRYRPDVPAWLEGLLLKAVAREPAGRFETAEEFLLALERGAARPDAVPRHRPRPWLARHGLAFWRGLAAVSLGINLLLLLWLLGR